MNERVFIDTNILVYAFLENDQEKHDEVTTLLLHAGGKEIFVSTQVLSEVYAALAKNGVEHDRIETHLFEIAEEMNIHMNDFRTILSYRGGLCCDSTISISYSKQIICVRIKYAGTRVSWFFEISRDFA